VLHKKLGVDKIFLDGEINKRVKYDKILEDCVNNII
jgi:hypothetical protein